MKEDMVCAGDVIREIEYAENLEVSNEDEIHTFSKGCSNFTLVCC